MGKLTFALAEHHFRTYLADSGRKPATIKTKLAFLQAFRRFLRARDVTDLRAVDRACMVGYLHHIRTVKRATGKEYTRTTRASLWTAARLLFQALYEYGMILADPMRRIRFDSVGDKRPRDTLSESEAAAFLDGIDADARLGLRDRALFELIYSSGLRAGEAARLVVGDIDFAARLIKIRQSKFSKDRVVPMTEAAAAFLVELVGDRAPELPVFRCDGRARMSRQTVNNRFQTLLARQGMRREGLSAHGLRHACATHLLAHGADLRYVQELLGHKSVQTTVVYTNEPVENLRRRYLRAHPRENDYRKTVDDAYRASFERFITRLGTRRAERLRYKQSRPYND